MNYYKKGQKDLIVNIKEEINKILGTTEGVDTMFDIIDFLKKLEPIDNKKSKNDLKEIINNVIRTTYWIGYNKGHSVSRNESKAVTSKELQSISEKITSGLIKKLDES